MPLVLCDGRAVPVRAGQSLLEALLEAGVEVASSCRAGACQSCMVQITRGLPPAGSQVGLRETLRAQGYMLACVAEVTEDLEISQRATRELEVSARVAEVSVIGRDVLRVLLAPSRPLPHRAGQFLTLVRPDGLSRAYSIASLPPDDPEAPCLLELHVRLLRAGRMGNWLASPDALGAEVSLRGPAGSCFYVPGSPTQRIVLAGTGTGLAPLWGIARDALRARHTGHIELWHGVREPSAFYLVDELRALASEHPQFQYRQCALEGASDASVATGRLDEALLGQGSFAGCRVYLCGDPDLVTTLKRRLFLAGAALRDIHADAFLTASSDSMPPRSASSPRPTPTAAPSSPLGR